MGRRRAKMPNFTIGDFVFAKVRGYRPWPGRILKRIGATAYSVYFYGTCNYAKVARKEVVGFEKNLNRLGVVQQKGHVCNPSFRGSMLQAREAYDNPDKDYGYYQQLALDNGDCINAEDLGLEYMVTEDLGNLMDEQAATEQEVAEKDVNEQEQNVELNSVGQIFSNQQHEENSEESASNCQLEEQEESNSEVEQVSEQHYSIAQIVSLKSKKLMDTPINMTCHRRR
ncbi:hepatoma-derived growth factor-related protein 3 [Drosophila sechellia]|uniref:GM25896 n=1 Tax=Drosophila sechellia TaxID=7238 RepID=B4HF74_DROSE|nr:hepatoma-derived growth factor-related protein 3 [Drosophila sechellia]EDW42248.1 GM25896 [Drosophila sechellia]